MRYMILTLSFLMAIGAEAQAQQQAPANAPYVTSTGKTVPQPGVIRQEGADRNIDKRTPDDKKMDRVTGSICKGC